MYLNSCVSIMFELSDSHSFNNKYTIEDLWALLLQSKVFKTLLAIVFLYFYFLTELSMKKPSFNQTFCSQVIIWKPKNYQF